MSKEQVLSVLGKRGPVALPNGLHVRPWTAAERADFLAWHRANRSADVFGELVVRSVCDPTGTLLLSADDKAGLDGAAVELVADKVIEINRLGGSDPKAG